MPSKNGFRLRVCFHLTTKGLVLLVWQGHGKEFTKASKLRYDAGFPENWGARGDISMIEFTQ